MYFFNTSVSNDSLNNMNPALKSKQTLTLIVLPLAFFYY